jgi:hypothetical protein
MTLNELREAIAAVVEYNWEDEARDFEACMHDGNDQEGHIFLTLQKLGAFIAEGE